MVITKSSLVYFDVLTPAMVSIFRALLYMDTKYTGIKPDKLVITAMSNGTHSPNSRHYTGEALDLRSHNFPTRISKRDFRFALEERLGPSFRVLLESEGTPNEHFHIQVRKGMVYIGEAL